MSPSASTKAILGLVGEAFRSQRVLEACPVPLATESAEYDALVRRHAWLLNRPFVEMVSDVARDLVRGRVLDVGTGPGWIPIELALRNPDWEIWALDASEDMLARARRHAAESGVADRVRFVHGDAQRLPFEDGRFDLSISHYMLHHLPAPARLFSEMARVTAPAGRILIKDLARRPRWMSAAMRVFSRVALGYNAEQLRMCRESLDSALTVGEVRAALAGSRLTGARVRGFRGMDYVVSARGGLMTRTGA